MDFVDYYSLNISDEEFSLLQDLIVQRTGIFINPAKRELLQNRLRPLLQKRGLRSYGQYYQWLIDEGDLQEIHELIQSITTNKTEFFRNEFQLEYFRGVVLPGFTEAMEKGESRSIELWSAGCSSGEEPYSLAICILETVPTQLHKRFRLIASDIDRQILERAQEGIYPSRSLEKLPKNLSQAYFRPYGKNYRAEATLRTMVEFRELNLSDVSGWPLAGLDVVFCRNVLIYMRQDIKRAIIKGFHRVLKPGGYLFLGHSETLHGIDAPLEYLEPSIYRKDE